MGHSMQTPFSTATSTAHQLYVLCTNFDWYACRKTDGVEYQNYSKAALQQLKTKLKRKRTRDSTLCYEMQDAPDVNIELIMHGLTSSVTLST